MRAVTPSKVVLFEMSIEVRTYASGRAPGAALVFVVVTDAAGKLSVSNPPGSLPAFLWYVFETPVTLSVTVRS